MADAGSHFLQWLATAKKGQATIYHLGLLMRDRVIPRSFGLLPHPRIDPIAKSVWDAYELGLVVLVQHREGDNAYVYYAIRTGRPINNRPDRTVTRPTTGRILRSGPAQ